jgi:hypothetical protein
MSTEMLSQSPSSFLRGEMFELNEHGNSVEVRKTLLLQHAHLLCRLY